MNTFNITSIISILTVTFNLILGILILHKRPYKTDQKLFFIFILFTSIWVLTSTFANYPFGLELQTFLLRLDFFIAPYAIYSYLVFVQYFGDVNPFINKPILYLLGAMSVVTSLLAAFTNVVIRDTFNVPAGIASKPGPIDIPFAIFLLFMLILSIISLITKIKKATGHERLQISYIAIGSITSAIALIVANLFLWRLLNLNVSTSNLVVLVIPSIGRSSTILISIFTAYAIIRHRLFGIRVILGEILFWLAGSALVFLFFYGTIVVELRFFDSLTDPLVIFLNVFIALLVFPTLRATNNWLRRAIRKITINVSFDRDHILSEYNKEITQSQATTEIVNSLCRLIDEAYAPKFAGLVLIEQRSSNITAEWRGLNPEELMIAQSEEAITQFFNETSVQKRGPLPGVDLQLLFEFPEYQGVLVLGDRKDTAAYANEDVQFLEQVLTYTALNLARTTR